MPKLDDDILMIVNMQCEFSGAVWNFQGITIYDRRGICTSLNGSRQMG